MTNNLFKEKEASPGSIAPSEAGRDGDTATSVSRFREQQGAGDLTRAAEPTAIQRAAEIKESMVSASQKRQLEKLAGIATFDWKQIPPPVMAELLMQTPFRGSATDPDYYLAPFQAYRFAIRCYELGLSPLSNEVWYNPKNNMTNVTFEGKLKLARLNGLNLSPPRFTRIPEDNTKPLAGYKCVIHAPSGDCEYTAYLKDWVVNSSPVWKSKPEHMLQLRAAEKCLSFATGTGSSELMGEPENTQCRFTAK
jgi:hypothetical protein